MIKFREDTKKKCTTLQIIPSGTIVMKKKPFIREKVFLDSFTYGTMTCSEYKKIFIVFYENKMRCQ